MEGFGKAPRDAEAKREKRDHYTEYISEMIIILNKLDEEHKDAFELFGGDIESSHIDETPLSGSAEEATILSAGLDTLREFAKVAETVADKSERDAKLQELDRRFHHILYGV